jgi:hypothetical protein
MTTAQKAIRLFAVLVAGCERPAPEGAEAEVLALLQAFGVATKRVAEFDAAVPAGRRLVAAPGGAVW